MIDPLSRLLRQAPVSCAPQTSIRAALETMRRGGADAIVVVSEEQAPLGLFTATDDLSRVALAGLDLDAPVSSVMTAAPAALPSQATAYEAALAMLRQGGRHLLVVDEGKLRGVVSERQLFGLGFGAMSELGGTIRAAPDLDAVAQLGGETRRLARDMLDQGAATEQLTQFIACLNDLLTQRIIDLELAEEGGVRVCWMALGSEGRYEQTFGTDQDNGIIFDAPAGVSVGAARERLVPVAKRINQALDRCGFPLCKGMIMAGNPTWCMSLGEWQTRFATWIDSGNPQALLEGSIFFDFRRLHGHGELEQALRRWLFEHVKGNPRFLHQMASNALRNQPPLGFLGKFTVEARGEHAHTLDLKLNGTTPFVDAARIFSLACGVSHTNTVRRLRAVAPLLNVPPAEVEAWIEGFLFIQSLRLRHQGTQASQDKEMDNRIDPSHLNKMDQHVLKEAFHQARQLQSRLALDYRV
ncbi:MAG: CBS domain-containing protein [Betaproteobacteria bacterium]|nr:CBS domain-containing protein [Betaproteobacteria bacterium]